MCDAESFYEHKRGFEACPARLTQSGMFADIAFDSSAVDEVPSVIIGLSLGCVFHSEFQLLIGTNDQDRWESVGLWLRLPVLIRVPHLQVLLYARAPH